MKTSRFLQILQLGLSVCLAATAMPDAEAARAVSVTNFNRPGYQVSSLSEGAPVYSDRNYTYVNIEKDSPGSTGTTYIKTRATDRLATGNDFLSFDVNEPVVVIVGLDQYLAGTRKPAWLSSFTDLSGFGPGLWQRGFNGQMVRMRGFARRFGPGTVKLGANGGGPNSVMYSVVVIPDTEAKPPAPAPAPTPTPPAPAPTPAGPAGKTRMLVLTDIGGDPDDEQSLVRLLLYSNEFDLEGFVASAHIYMENGAVVRPDLIEQRVRAYGQVRNNLLRHRGGYPAAEELLSRIKRGNPDALSRMFDPNPFRAMGEGKDTEGSELIIAAVDRPDPRPLWITVWGGANELAQAIFKVSRTRTPQQLAAFKSKIRVHSVGDQDATGPWLEQNHPDLFWLRNGRENFEEGPEQQMIRGMFQLGDLSSTTRQWVENNVTLSHGPLGQQYPIIATTDRNNAAMKEGDTPAWFYLIQNGLGDQNQPGWGGWGGRFVKAGPRFDDAVDSAVGVTNERACIARWRPQFQNDFEARMDWNVRSPAEANHEPTPLLQGAGGLGAVRLQAKAGSTVSLSAEGSSDPDGDELGYSWLYYREAGNYGGGVTIDGGNASRASVRVPSDAAGKTVHVILMVTDRGTPALTRYRRAVISVTP